MFFFISSVVPWSSRRRVYAWFDRVALELRSLLCTFENSTSCSKISFDSDSFLE